MLLLLAYVLVLLVIAAVLSLYERGMSSVMQHVSMEKLNDTRQRLHVASLSVLYCAATAASGLGSKLVANQVTEFSFPITMAVIEFCTDGIVCRMILLCMAKSFRKGDTVASHVNPCTGSLTAAEFLQFVVPPMVAGAITNLCTLSALMYSEVEIFVPIKRTTIMWTFLISVGLGLRRWNTILALLVAGVAASSATAAVSADGWSYNHSGALLAMGSAVSGSIRWSFMQRLVHRYEQFKSPTLAMATMAPWRALITLPFALILEGKLIWDAGQDSLAKVAAGAGCAVIVALFGLTTQWVQLRLVAITSAVSLQAIGSVRDLSNLVVGAESFGESLSARVLVCNFLSAGFAGGYFVVRDAEKSAEAAAKKEQIAVLKGNEQGDAEAGIKDAVLLLEPSKSRDANPGAKTADDERQNNNGSQTSEMFPLLGEATPEEKGAG